MREAAEVFYSKALEAFREARGTEEEFKWLVGSGLALYPAHRGEVGLRLKSMEEIVKRAEGRILDVGSSS